MNFIWGSSYYVALCKKEVYVWERPAFHLSNNLARRFSPFANAFVQKSEPIYSHARGEHNKSAAAAENPIS